MRTIFQLLVSVLPGLAFAQGLHPLPTGVDARRLAPGVLSGLIYLVRGTDTAQTGTWASEIVVRNDSLIHVVGTYDRLLGRGVDTLILRSPDLQPIAYAHSSLSGPVAGNAHITFGAARSVGSISTGGGEVTRIDNARPPAAWYMGSLALVVAAADIRDGGAFSIPAFIENDSNVVRIDLTVAGSERVRTHDCWKIVADSANDMAFWIDQKSRAIVRRTITPAPGILVVFDASGRPSATGRAP